MSNIRARIIGTGLGVPSRLVTNNDLAKFVDTSDEWITARTGIRSRYLVDQEKGETNSQLGTEATRQALELAQVKASEIDLVIYCTVTPDTFMPNTASRVIGSLKMTKAAGFDLNTACTGFVSGLMVADGLIRSGLHKKIVVIGAEAMSAFLDWSDRRTCVLFGDGAGAVVIEGFDCQDPTTESCIIGSKLYVTYDQNDALTVAGGGSKTPAHDPKFMKTIKPYMAMSGQEVFKAGSRGMIDAARAVLDEYKYSLNDMTWLVPHQANIRMIEMIAKVLDLPMSKVFTNLDRWGNTTAGTIPIALAEMNQQKLLNKGDLVVADAFGGGFNYGAVLLRW